MSVSRRLVLYLPGYDPRPTKVYYKLFRQEAARQASVSGHEIEVGPIERHSRRVIQWRVDATVEGERVETRYRLLRWDDIVRATWARTPGALVRTSLATSAEALFTGVLGKTWQWSWPAAVTCAMPFFLIIGLLLLCSTLPIAGWALGSLAGGAGAWIGLGFGLAAGLGLFGLAFRLERKFNLTWIGRIINFIAGDSREAFPAIEARRAEFATHLEAELATGDHDEILVVGHSLGTTLALSIVARNLGAARASRSRLSLLTLGQTNCWLAFFRRAERFRTEIAAAAESEDIDWLDFSAPPDAACFALVDPYTAIGDRRTDRRNPKLLNPKFHEIMAPADFARGSRNWVELHFQYVSATVIPADYDYFAITAGPKTLWGRFANRPSVRNFTRLRSKAMKHVR